MFNGFSVTKAVLCEHAKQARPSIKIWNPRHQRYVLVVVHLIAIGGLHLLLYLYDNSNNKYLTNNGTFDLILVLVVISENATTS